MTYGAKSRERLVELSLSELRDMLDDAEIELIDNHQRELADTALPELHESSFVPDTKNDEQRGRFLLLCINSELYDEEIEEFIDADPVIQTLAREKQNQEKHVHARALRARRSIAALLFETAKTIPSHNTLGKAA